MDRKIEAVSEKTKKLILNQYIKKNLSESEMEEMNKTFNTLNEQIKRDVKKNVESLVNVEIEKQLSIPDDVLLHRDSIYRTDYKEEHVMKLFDEVEKYQDWIKNYANFIKILNNEWETYQIEDKLIMENQIMKIAEDFLNKSIHNPEMLINNLKKLSSP